IHIPTKYNKIKKIKKKIKCFFFLSPPTPEELKIYIVGGKPHIDEPHVGEWKSWHYRQYPLIARELWDLLARDKIASGSIDKALDDLPKKAAGTGKARQQWLIKPDRTRALDTDF